MSVVYAADTFNRADSATMGNCDTGQPWQNADQWGIVDLTARKGGGLPGPWVAAGAVLDHYVQTNIILSDYVGGNQLLGTLSRFAGDNDFVLWERVLVPGVEDSVKLYLRIGGLFVQRGIFGGPPDSTGIVPTDNLTLRIDHVGTLVTCWVNGSEVVTYVLSPVEDAALGVNAGIWNEGVLEPRFNGFIAESIDPLPATGLARKVALRSHRSIPVPPRSL